MSPGLREFVLPQIISILREVAGLDSHQLLDQYNIGMFRCRLDYTYEISKSVHQNNISIT